MTYMLEQKKYLILPDFYIKQYCSELFIIPYYYKFICPSNSQTNTYGKYAAVIFFVIKHN